MILAVLLGALTLASPPLLDGQDAAYAEVQALLGERRLGEAWDLVPEIGDPLLAAQAKAELFYLARDFPRCMEAAAEGLSQAPGDLLLLYRGLGAALWMRDGIRGIAWSARLGAALEAAEIGPEERVWWDETAAVLRSDAEGLVATSEARERRVRGARAVSLLLIATVLIGLALLAREPARAPG